MESLGMYTYEGWSENRVLWKAEFDWDMVYLSMLMETFRNYDGCG